VLALLASIAVARALGKTGFGEFGMVQSTIGLFGTFAGFAMGFTASKHIAEFRAADRQRAGRIMALSSVTAAATGLLAAAGLFIAAPFLAEKTLAAPRLAPLLRIGSLYLFFSAVNGAQTGALTGFEAFRTIAKLNFAIGLSYFPLVVGGVWLGGLEGAVWGLTLSMAFGWAVTHLALRKAAAVAGVPFHFDRCLHEINILWTFSVPVVISGFTYTLAMWVCNALLANRINGYEDLGIVNAVMRLYSVILFLPATISSSLFPILSWEKSNGPSHNKETFFRKGLLVGFILTAIIAIPAAIFPQKALSIYGSDYKDNFKLLQIMCGTAILTNIAGILKLEIASAGKTWLNFWVNLIWAVALVTITGLLIDRGALSIIMAQFVAAAVQIGVSWWLYTKILAGGTAQ